MGSKNNEIAAIPQLLDLPELSGCVVTIDAIGTQTNIVEQIVDADGDYVLTLKDNQPTLHEIVREYGRIEVRKCWASENIGWLESKSKWKKLRSICMVKSVRTIGEQQSETSTRYFITSLPADAQRLATVIRSHWSIENSLHWVMDIGFREDECRKRKDNSAENFSMLRHLTLNLPTREKTCKRSIKGKRLLAGWDEAYLEKVLFGG